MQISRVIPILVCFAIFGGDRIAARAQSQLPSSETMILAPKNIHEECLQLSKGQTVSFVFESSQPIDFKLHYHQGNEVTYPINSQ